MTGTSKYCDMTNVAATPLDRSGNDRAKTAARMTAGFCGKASSPRYIRESETQPWLIGLLISSSIMYRSKSDGRTVSKQKLKKSELVPGADPTSNFTIRERLLEVVEKDVTETGFVRAQSVARRHTRSHHSYPDLLPSQCFGKECLDTSRGSLGRDRRRQTLLSDVA